MGISNPVCAWHFAGRSLGNKVSGEGDIQRIVWCSGRVGMTRKDGWHEAHNGEGGTNIAPHLEVVHKGLGPPE